MKVPTDKEMSELKEAFDKAMLSLIKDEQGKLNSLRTQQESLSVQVKELQEKQRAAQYPEYSAISDEKEKVRLTLRKTSAAIHNQENIVLSLENGGIVSTLTDKLGEEHTSIPDLRRVDTNSIVFDVESILVDNKPPYIANIDEDTFRSKGYVFDAIRVDRDSYLLATMGYNEGSGASLSGYEQPTFYVLVTLDQLVLTSDYYYTRAKAHELKRAEEKNERSEKHWDEQHDSRKERFLNQVNQEYVYKQLPAKKKKEVSFEKWITLTWEEKAEIHKFYKRSKGKRLTSKLGEKYMWSSFHKMYERFVDPTATNPKPRVAHPDAFAYWVEFREMMDYKIKDIHIQRADLSEIRKAAIETSFGESNTNDSLISTLGILVKRQNGDIITPFEIEQIEKAYSEVQKTFGNLKPNALKYKLKISHTAKKYVFASKAVGMYVPSMGTIAVSDKYGNEQFNSTMAHEIAHFIDNFIGELNGKRYATDDYESIAGKIAFQFRNNMNKPKSEQTEYINATKECFARALQQYFGIETLGDNAGIAFSSEPLDGMKPFYTVDSFVDKQAYDGLIKPLIKVFFEENKDIFEFTVDVDESNEPVDIGTEKETKSDKSEQLAKEIKQEVEILSELLTDAREDKNSALIEELEDRIEFLQELSTETFSEGGKTGKMTLEEYTAKLMKLNEQAKKGEITGEELLEESAQLASDYTGVERRTVTTTTAYHSKPPEKTRERKEDPNRPISKMTKHEIMQAAYKIDYERASKTNWAESSTKSLRVRYSDIIKEKGGKLDETKTDVKTIRTLLKENGTVSIECYHPEINESYSVNITDGQESQEITTMTCKNGKCNTGGSNHFGTSEAWEKKINNYIKRCQKRGITAIR